MNYHDAGYILLILQAPNRVPIMSASALAPTHILRSLHVDSIPDSHELYENNSLTDVDAIFNTFGKFLDFM